MKRIRGVTLAALFGALLLSGCNRYVVDIHPAEPSAAEQQSSRKGNIHILPIEKGPLILEVEPGLTNLDQRWAILNQRTNSALAGNSIEPSEFVTTVDLTKLLQERTQASLKKAGFKVAEGDYIPGEADVIVVQSLQLAFVSLSGPSCPTAIVQVWAHIRNAKTGAHVTDIITGHGKILNYLTYGQGLEKAINQALEEYQTKLVRDTKEQISYVVENRVFVPGPGSGLERQVSRPAMSTADSLLPGGRLK